MNGKKILIIGGAGFIGSNLARELCRDNKVTIIDNFSNSKEENIKNLNIEIKKLDITRDDLNEVVKNKDVIYHLASYPGHLESVENIFDDLNVNVKGTLNLLEACKKNNRKVKIIYTGTRAQYGEIEYTPVDEKHPLNPVDAQGITKHAAEQYLRLYNRFYNMKFVSLRLTNVYGISVSKKDSGVLPMFIKKAMEDGILNVYGGGRNLRDFNYVDDVVKALILVGESDEANNEVYNLGGDVMSILDIAKKIIRIVGKGQLRICPYPEGIDKIEVGDYIADIRKIRKLRWKAEVGFEEGLRKIIEYYKNDRNY